MLKRPCTRLKKGWHNVRASEVTHIVRLRMSRCAILKSLWYYLLTALLSLTLTLGGCFPSAPPPARGYLTLIQPRDLDNYGAATYACVGDRVQLRYELERVASATLSANPTDALAPALNATQVFGEDTLSFEVLGATTLTLDYQEDVTTRRLELIPESVCADLPTDLLKRFTGTLQQETPEPRTLERRLEFFWRDAGLEAVLFENEPYYGYDVQLRCSAESETASVNCAGVDTDFSLNATLSTNGLTGSYQGSTQGSVLTSTFAGTFTFRAP